MRIGTQASVHTTVALALERYCAVCLPHRYQIILNLKYLERYWWFVNCTGKGRVEKNCIKAVRLTAWGGEVNPSGQPDCFSHFFEPFLNKEDRYKTVLQAQFNILANETFSFHRKTSLCNSSTAIGLITVLLLFTNKQQITICQLFIILTRC